MTTTPSWSLTKGLPTWEEVLESEQFVLAAPTTSTKNFPLLCETHSRLITEELSWSIRALVKSLINAGRGTVGVRQVAARCSTGTAGANAEGWVVGGAWISGIRATLAAREVAVVVEFFVTEGEKLDQVLPPRGMVALVLDDGEQRHVVTGMVVPGAGQPPHHHPSLTFAPAGGKASFLFLPARLSDVGKLMGLSLLEVAVVHTKNPVMEGIRVVSNVLANHSRCAVKDSELLRAVAGAVAGAGAGAVAVAAPDPAPTSAPARAPGSLALDESQEAAVRLGIRGPLTLVQGPHGTGKTSLTVELVCRILAEDPTARVLVVAHTNFAVDHFLDLLLRRVPEDAVARVGDRSRSHALSKVHLAVRARAQAGAKGLAAREYKRALAATIAQSLSEGDPGSREWLMHAHAFKSVVAEAVEAMRAPMCSILASGSVRVVGATTAGAAAFSDVLAAFSASTLICEEASEILESHVLACVTPGVTDRLVLIGDQYQLRPNVTSHTLRSVFHLDVSLFERLLQSATPPPCARLVMQRRMRPEISRLLTCTLYPWVVDADETHRLAPPEGLQGPSALFLAHQWAAAGAGSSSNPREALMCAQLAAHLRRNNPSASIVLLTPFHDQAGALRRALTDLGLPVMAVAEAGAFFPAPSAEGLVPVSEDRTDFFGGGSLDEDPLAAEERASVSAAAVADVAGTRAPGTVRVATLDTFMGDEADVVIVSLSFPRLHGVGKFLEDARRATVTLSRARRGLFLVGDRRAIDNTAHDNPQALLVQVLRLLDASGAAVKGLTLQGCPRHGTPGAEVATPEQFASLAPAGHCCTQPCGQPLPCGHACSKPCHPGPCPPMQCGAELRRPAPCGHPCTGMPPSPDPAAPCSHPVTVTLTGCGHLGSVPCSSSSEPFRGDCKAADASAFLHLQAGGPQQQLPKRTRCLTSLRAIARPRERPPPAPKASDGPAINECKICFAEGVPLLACIPCGHTVTCETCSTKVSECAICRAPIERLLKLFFA